MQLIGLVLASIFGICVGVLCHSILTIGHQQQKTSWLVLRLLDDYNTGRTGQEIAESILFGSMGLVTLPIKSIARILRTQAKAGLIRSVSSGDWTVSTFEITQKGRAHLNRITKLVHTECEEREQ